MNKKQTPLGVGLASLVALIGAAAPAHAFSTDDYYETRAAHDSGQPVLALVDYVGTQRVDVKMYLADKPGDTRCDGGFVTLYDKDWNQLGNRVQVGSVCRGQVAWTPVKPISTAAGVIKFVRLDFNNGVGAVCIRDYDGSEACR